MTEMPRQAQVLVLETFPAVLAHAIARSGLRLDHLCDRLSERGARVSLTTLNHWRRGQVRPDLAVSAADITVLEDVLGLATGRLSGLLLPSRR
ncbi:hypothetical protein [Actinophytocola algeriensis]|uniref:Transcriptional regulator n=1 Tax=Actinophytocola algeriensis TaxID=1768010 RepID=A0A7W7QDL0_9PSEU|nr:hypothetical protein [Actinophytocola algeriensis]MBB4911687.1 hypothetical protein [Actinophytocola algeriensis]MBE1473325.1 hypothetical protein [Actinophytocola algeriensis]